jgi:hypothetical protein
MDREGPTQLPRLPIGAQRSRADGICLVQHGVTAQLEPRLRYCESETDHKREQPQDCCLQRRNVLAAIACTLAKPVAELGSRHDQ